MLATAVQHAQMHALSPDRSNGDCREAGVETLAALALISDASTASLVR
jgi:hypothetical protein